MTAEIAICNANGIALAADSAVSMGNGEKIYNSANKLFSLSKHHPVAIMVYNSGSLLNVPWETIIKQYREDLGAHEFGTLQEYGDSFWSFIQTKMAWFPEADRNAFIAAKVHRLLLEIRGHFINHISECEVDTDDDEAVRSALARSISACRQIANEFDFADGFGDADITSLLDEHELLFAEQAALILEDLYQSLSDENRNELHWICAASLTNSFFDHYSGVVIAGFGRNEIHPKVASYKAGIFVNGRLRLYFDELLSNTLHDKFVPQIFPYAQDDVVRSFINGIDPEIDKYLNTVLSEIPKLAEQLPVAALAGEDEDQRNASREQIRDTVKAFSEDLLRNYNQTKFELGTSELLAMLNVLPKDELAEMAESLVNLTAFKRRMTAAKESVGGPVDVAILSKGDGFIWIKRKHYFKPELNQHFFHNYFSE